MVRNMKVRYSFIAKVCGFLCISWALGLQLALAQYDDIRYPQKPEEIALYKKNIFFYDSKLRFKEALYYSPDHYRTAHFIKNYGDDGRLYNECEVQMAKAYKDSVLSVNEYNDKKQLIKRQVFTFLDFKYSKKGSKYFNRSASHYGAATYEYNLDSLGRPVAQEYSVKDDKLNYSFSTWTYDKNGLITKDSYLYGHGDPKITSHEYYYYQ